MRDTDSLTSAANPAAASSFPTAAAGSAAAEAVSSTFSWGKVQAISGSIFAVFVLLHLLNTWLLSVSFAAYDGLQAWLRPVYQSPAIEALILSALLTHAVAGIRQLAQKRNAPLSTRQRWHRRAGIFLLVFVFGHIAAVRGPSWFLDIFLGAEGVAFSVSFVPAFFYPYYFLLAMAGLFHALNGLAIASHRLGFARLAMSMRGPMRGFLVAGGFLTMAALAGAGGWIYDIGDVSQGAFAKLVTSIYSSL